MYCQLKVVLEKQNLSIIENARTRIAAKFKPEAEILCGSSQLCTMKNISYTKIMSSNNPGSDVTCKIKYFKTYQDIEHDNFT